MSASTSSLPQERARSVTTNSSRRARSWGRDDVLADISTDICTVSLLLESAGHCVGRDCVEWISAVQTTKTTEVVTASNKSCDLLVVVYRG